MSEAPEETAGAPPGMLFCPGNQALHALGFHWLVSCRIRIMRGKLQRLDNLPSAPHPPYILLPSGFHTRLQLYSWPAVYELMSAASLSHTLSVTHIHSPPRCKGPASFGCFRRLLVPNLGEVWGGRCWRYNDVVWTLVTLDTLHLSGRE